MARSLSRDERTTKDLRKQIEQARPIQLNRSGLAGAWAPTLRIGAPERRARGLVPELGLKGGARAC